MSARSLRTTNRAFGEDDCSSASVTAVTIRDSAATTGYLLPGDRELVRSLRRQLHGTMGLLLSLIGDKQSHYVEHAKSVARLTHSVGVELGVDGDLLEDLKTAALIHDLGMLRLPFGHSGSQWHLPPEERRLFVSHPDVGAELAMLMGLPAVVRSAVRSHHERCDGSGFPCGLDRDRIPVGARILAVCDAFDELVRGEDEIDPVPLTFDQALEAIQAQAGLAFDADVVKALESALESEREVRALTGLAL